MYAAGQHSSSYNVLLCCVLLIASSNPFDITTRMSSILYHHFNSQLRVPSVTGLLWDILRENMVQARKDAKAKRETRGEGKKKKIPFIGEDIRSFMTQRTKATSKQQ